jgi:hypothetical protein
MALIESEEDRQDLREHSLQNSLAQWKQMLVLKVTAVGVLTGLPTGPIGLAAEVLDIAYLMSACGRACYGIGYIVRGDVDYDKDIPLILAIWSGAAETCACAVAGKTCLKVGGKLAAAVGTTAAAKVGGKILAKVAPKAAAKITAKLGAKAASPWIPVVGSVVSAGINYWIASDLMEAAEKYYRSEFVREAGNYDWIAEDVREISDNYPDNDDPPLF